METAISSQAPGRPARILETQAAYYTWQDVCAVRVRGEDRVRWLNGQLTADVREIAAGSSVHALAVNVRGKILAEVWVADAGDDTLLLLIRGAAKASAPLLESLDKYIIMEDVTLEPAPLLGVLAIEGPDSEALASQVDAAGALSVTCAPLGLGGRLWIGEAAALERVRAQLAERVPEIDAAGYELVRLRHSVPRYGADFDEHQYPQEVGLKSLVSFQKGCYLGQEVVCTLENRGKLSRQLWLMQGKTAAQPASDTPLQLPDAADSGQAVGAVTTAVWDPEHGTSHVLGYVRRTHAVAGATVRAGTQSLTLIRPVGESEVAV
jgi:folate-binding protein YgfZ